MVADLSSLSKGNDSKVVSQHHNPKSGENLNFFLLIQRNVIIQTIGGS
jgi:hypothetical protein